MGRPTIDATATEDDSTELTITIDKGNKQWVARIDGTDTQYGLDRGFVSPYGRGTNIVTVDDGAEIETCWHSHSGNAKGRRYEVVVDGQLCEIDDEDVERALDATVVRIDGQSVADTDAPDADGDPAAVTDGGEADPTNEPLEGYEAETTGDYREADGSTPQGDGVYKRDYEGESLTEEIAQLVTRQGGRIPADFRARTQNEGYARSRMWTVYAPESNPYHIAADVTDLLREAGIDDPAVHVETETPRDAAQHLRMTRLNYTVDKDEEDLLDEYLRQIRWMGGLGREARREIHEDADSAWSEIADEDDGRLADGNADDRTRTRIHRIANTPGDAWECCHVSISIHEDADNPYYG
jgi:hypothetical protein